ncbi:WecB/TagA/CpsF family glycosyltransferase [Methylovorus sp. SPW-M1]
MSNADKTVEIANYPVLETNPERLSAQIYARIAAGHQTLLFYSNTNFIVQCDHLRQRLDNQDVIIVNDGIGMDIAKWLLTGKRFSCNLNGTDFTPYLLSHASKPMRVFLLGAKPEVVEKAAMHVSQNLNQLVTGYADGYASMRDEQSLIARIKAAAPDLLLVAMGNPKQEEWILQHAHQLDIPVISGVGALFDFWSGTKARAPLWVQKIRMEWFYRLCLEPKRLIKRYSVDIVKFFYILRVNRKTRK